MSSYPPPPPPYQPPGVPPPQFPPVSPPRGPHAARGNVALKVLIGSAVGLGVGFGTCGLALVMGQQRNQGARQIAAQLGLYLFLVSLMGLVVSGIWLLVAAIVGRMRR